MTVYFVTRHEGAEEWARRQGIEATPIGHLDVGTVRAGDVVIGTLPLHLAAEVCARGATYRHLAIDVPADRRGEPLSADEMEAFNARLQNYEIKRTFPT